MNNLKIRILPQKMLTILLSFTLFIVLYLKAVHRLVINESYVVCICTVLLTIVNYNSIKLRYGNKVITIFIVITIFVIFARFLFIHVDLESTIYDLLLMISLLFLMCLSNDVLRIILYGAMIGVICILLVWLKFQYDNGGMTHIVYIGNRWGIVFFNGGIISVYLQLFKNKNIKRIILNMLFWFTIITLSSSRTALIVYVAFCILLIFELIKNNLTRKKMLLYSIFLLILILFCFTFFDRILLLLNGKWQNATMESSIDIRLDMWNILFSKFSLFGITTDSDIYNNLYGKYGVSNFHNTFVQAYTYGAIVFTAYLALNVLCLVIGKRNIKDNSNHLIYIVLAYVGLGIFESYFVLDRTYIYAGIIFFIFANMLANGQIINRQNSRRIKI